MLLKDFVNLHQEKFKKTPFEIYNTDKEFLQDLIKKYPNRVPNVFVEIETKELHKTRFYKWWDNKRFYFKDTIKPIEHNEVIKKTKKVVKEKIVKEIKEKPIKIKKTKEKKIKAKEEEQTDLKQTKQEIILNNTQEEEQNNKQTYIIEQTKEYNQVYHKVVFKTELASEMYKTIDINLKRIKIKCFEISAMIKEYKDKITNHPLQADLYYKQLQCYEKMYKIQSDAFNDYQGQLIQLRMTIENDKQIYENGFYEKTIENDMQNKTTNEILTSEGITNKEDIEGVMNILNEYSKNIE